MKPTADASETAYPDPSLKDLKLNITTFPRYLCLLMIKAYQRWISPGIALGIEHDVPGAVDVTYQDVARL